MFNTINIESTFKALKLDNLSLTSEPQTDGNAAAAAIIMCPQVIGNSVWSLRFAHDSAGKVKYMYIVCTGKHISKLWNLAKLHQICNKVAKKYKSDEDNFLMGFHNPLYYIQMANQETITGYYFSEPTLPMLKFAINLLSLVSTDDEDSTQRVFDAEIRKSYPAAYHEYIYDPVPNPVTEFYTTHQDVYDLLLKFVVKCLYTNSIKPGRADLVYKPRPVYISTITTSSSNTELINSRIPVDSIVNKLIDIDKYLTTQGQGGAGEGLDTIGQAVDTGDRAIRSISQIGYDMIYCAIRYFNLFQLEKMQNAVENIKMSGVKIYRVKYNDLSFSAKFDKLMGQPGTTAFHGSPLENWYSIFNNGLYVPTTADQVINGAAYGTGVYLSNTCSYSAGYCRSRAKVPDFVEEYFKLPHVMGVFTVLDGIAKYCKAGNIHVVDDSKVLCLRYLIVSSSSGSISKHAAELDTLFIAGKMTESFNKEQQMKSVRGMGRIMKEIRELTQNVDTSEELKYTFSYDESNLMQWRFNLLIDNFHDKDKSATNQSDLYKDMVALGIKQIEFEIRLPDDYPFRPPFVRIITPKFLPMTGYVTVGGSICFELLTPNGWVAAMSIYKVMIAVMINLQDGGARLDPVGTMSQYQYNDAVAAFSRMLKSHKADWGTGK